MGEMEKRTILNPKKVGKSQLELENLFRKFMVDQDRAIKHLARRILYANSSGGRLRDARKPAGTFFYLGPTGVGKTKLVEIFAYLLFGSFDAMVKINCSELQHSHEIARLIGSPPGYIRSDQEPWLSQRRLDYWGFVTERLDSDSGKELQTLQEKLSELEERIKKIKDEVGTRAEASASQLEELKKFKNEVEILMRQYKKLSKKADYMPASYPSILLFDEIEKASPALFNLLLQVHDKATLTVHGEVPDDNHEVLFHNTFIFYTSNVAQDQIKRLIRNSKIGFASSFVSESELDEQIYDMALGQLEKIFSSEFLGRIRKENIIVFSPLNKNQIREGLDRIIFPDFLSRFTASFPVTVVMTEEARGYLVAEAFDAKSKIFGMRAMESVFTKRVEEELVNLTQKSPEEGNIIPGDEVLIDFKGTDLVFSVKERTPDQIEGAKLADKVSKKFMDKNYNPDGRRVVAVFKVKTP
ncbi:MAG: ATP-dependent Clp protease ATP-binding subunit [Candidatus Yanofskybacteria bacterium]|nr:ATP-dependent Clp protease ATP-binding subunit [Candidatus Yanofskybacteria bacterium]